MTEKKAIHFPGLNGIRAIAAISVILLHSNQMLPIFNQNPLFKGTEIAELSVVLFFVLSGFLITFLLLEEKERFGKINVKNFYLKRILRIWPPYFLALILAVLLFPLYKSIPGNPKDNFLETILLFSLILPNVSSALQLMLTPLRPFWSIGVEEQFYVIWPLIIKKAKKASSAIVIFIVIYLFINILVLILSRKYPSLAVFYTLISITPLHIMALGALGSVWFRTQSKVLKIIYHPLVQCSAILLWVFSYFVDIKIPYVKHEIYAGLFLVIILNIATNKKSILKLEGKLPDFLGRISYGMYVYHMLIIVVLSIFMKDLMLNSWVLMIFILITSILFSTLSYFYYEKWFLNIKGKLAVVKSES